MVQLSNLPDEEKAALLKFPAYISLLASRNDGKIDKVEKKSVIKFSHIKTFSCAPLLAEFYKEADKVFEKNLEQLDKELPENKVDREAAIKKQLAVLQAIVLKLGNDYSATMYRSMASFTAHVKKSHHSFLEDFIFPVPIHGLTD